MAAPLVGRRVRITNLESKPELNGQHGLAVAFDDSKGRYNVKLESDGAFVSLKPAALLAADAHRTGMGGMPGMGGMRGILPLLLARLFAGGMQPQHLLVGAGLLFFVLPRLLGIRMLPMILLGGLATFVMRSSAGGKGLHGVVQSGRDVIDRIGAAVGRATGKELSTAQTALLLAGVAYLMYQYNPLGSAPASSGETGSTGALSAPSVPCMRQPP